MQGKTMFRAMVFTILMIIVVYAIDNTVTIANPHTNFKIQ